LIWELTGLLPQKKWTVQKDLILTSLPGQISAVASAEFEIEKCQKNWVGRIIPEVFWTQGLNCFDFFDKEEICAPAGS